VAGPLIPLLTLDFIYVVIKCRGISALSFARDLETLEARGEYNRDRTRSWTGTRSESIPPDN